jgi:hypothetical protein
MKNSLADLTDHLFVALERLNDEALAPDVVRSEIQRANAIATVAREIIGAGNLAVNAARVLSDDPSRPGPRLLGLAGPADAGKGPR